MNTKLYIGNLSFDTTEQDLTDLLSQHGAVTEVAVMTDRMTGRPRGFAFATMADAAGADAVIRALNGQDFMGRPLTVNEARPREERPAYSGGRGGYGGGRGGDRGDRGDRGGYGGRRY
jgi:RNA recognition motif-containing protein